MSERLRHYIPMLVLPWLSPLLATLLSIWLYPVVPAANLALVYLAGVLLTAIHTRVLPALACALLSFLAYNFFLTEPRLSLQMFHGEDVLTAGLLVMVALLCGHLAARLNEQLAALRDSQRWGVQQMSCARALSACVDAQGVQAVCAEQLQQTLGWPLDDAREAEDWQGIEVQQGIGWRAGVDGLVVCFELTDGPRRYLRLRAPQPLGRDTRQRFEALLELCRLAWQRVQLAARLRDETLIKEREQLRSALLSSISHDLRTPLATMIGSVSSLIDLHDALGEAQKAELLGNTLSEARRLDRYIQKLLDMTRLGYGELPLDRDWVAVDEIVGVVLRRCRGLLGDLQLQVQVPHDLPLLHVHAALIEQALFNVLENAIRFSPAAGTVSLNAAIDQGALVIDVADQGPGIAAESRSQVFDMFHTFSHGDQYPGGTGLGLAICRGIMAAHRGSVEVLRSEPGVGTCMRLSLPLTKQGGVHDAHSGD